MRTELPSAEIYDQEMRYMPWGKLLDSASLTISLMSGWKNEGNVTAPILDLMCGTGYLLKKIAERQSRAGFHTLV